VINERRRKDKRSSTEPPTVKIEDFNIPSRIRLREESDNSDETEGEIEGTDGLLDNSSDEADWTPGSYLQRKLRNDMTSDIVMYELSSRRVGRSGSKVNRDMNNETSEQAGNRLVQPSA